jgi:hypothetical protein
MYHEREREAGLSSSCGGWDETTTLAYSGAHANITPHVLT